MLKKAEVINALENGAHILVNDIYRSASVWTDDGQELGTCRFDTAQRLAKEPGYTIENLGAWSFSWRILKEKPEPEKTAFNWEDIRGLCIENCWYTHGTNAEYENLYSMVNAGASLDTLARDIYKHSGRPNCPDVDTVRAALLALGTAPDPADVDIVSNPLKNAIVKLESGEWCPVDGLTLEEIRWLKSEYGEKLHKINAVTINGPRAMLYVCW